MLHDEAQVLEILARQGAQSKVGLRQVDALVRTESSAARGRVRNPNPGAIRFDRLDPASDPSVVEPDRLAGPCIAEDLGERHANLRGEDHVAIVVADRRPPGTPSGVSTNTSPTCSVSACSRTGTSATRRMSPSVPLGMRSSVPGTI